MFYSHEILSNSQYGVATIWLVATIGKANHRKVTKKAIQEVNVPRACEKIIEPGAPLALRLQGNLLYGVSRVFAQQCGYVLVDAEKTQSDMMTFFRVMQTNETDPKAGKSKRHQITLEDDPNFDILSALPKLDLFNTGNDLVFLSNQFSSQNVSQMTPLGSLSQGTPSSGRNVPLFGFDLPSSSHSAGSYHLPSDFGHQTSPFPKPFGEAEAMAEFSPFGDEDIDFMGINLNFDADGNLIGEVEPEPELPALPGTESHRAQVQQQVLNAGAGNLEQDPIVGDDQVFIMGEDALPDAEPFPKRPAGKQPYTSSTQTTETIECEQVIAPVKRARRRKVQLMLDPNDRISSREFNSWSLHYLNNMDASRKRPKLTTQGQARRNAMAFLYDHGLQDVGVLREVAGIAHPLADHFAGASLRARLQGRYPDENEQIAERPRRRRSSAEAFDEDAVGQRRVKQRVDEGPGVGRGIDDDVGMMLGDDTAPELGMEAAPAMEDRHSSSMMPWSRPPSVVPGSSVRGHGSAQKGLNAPSPLLDCGSVVPSIERHSDLPGSAFGSDDFAQLLSQDSSLHLGGLAEKLGFGQALDTQTSNVGLDLASQEFLGYAMQHANEKGQTRARDADVRRWIDFEKLADPATHSKSVAAQAFLHVLSLTTKNFIVVEQEGIHEQQPFGTIRVGLLTSHDDDDSEDELA